MDSPKEVAEKTKAYFKEEAGSLQDAADILEISPTNLSNILSGKKYLSHKKAFEFANISHLNPKYLMTGEGDMLLPSDKVPGYECFTYALSPKAIKAAKPDKKEQELINAILKNYGPGQDSFLFFFSTHSFPETSLTFKEAKQIILRLASVLIEEASLTPKEQVQLKIPNFSNYHHLITELMIQTQKDDKGYIQANINPDYVIKKDFGRDEKVLSSPLPEPIKYELPKDLPF